MTREGDTARHGLEESAAAPFAGADPALARARVASAVSRLEERGVLAGKRTARLSVRVDPGLMRAARARLGPSSDSEVVTAGLAMLGGEDDFGAWLVSQADSLPEDFELEF